MIYNNDNAGAQAFACGEDEDESDQARSVCFKITGIPSSTLSLYCGSTQVQVHEIQEKPDIVSCLNVTCGANLTVVAANCFANDSKVVPGR